MSWIISCVCQLFGGVWLFVTPLSMGLFRQEYRSGLPFSSPRGSSRPRDWTQVSCLLHCQRVLYLLSHWGSPTWCQLERPFQPQLCNCLSSFTDLPLRPGFINFLPACNDLKMQEISCSSISASFVAVKRLSKEVAFSCLDNSQFRVTRGPAYWLLNISQYSMKYFTYSEYFKIAHWF